MNGFLPISKQDMTDRGWYYCDFLIVTGDAYVRSSRRSGTAIISRVLEDAGYKVAILQPAGFHDEHDFLEMGRPLCGAHQRRQLPSTRWSRTLHLGEKAPFRTMRTRRAVWAASA